MEAGRELDQLIAEKVFNVEVEGELIKRYIDGRWWVQLPHYSTYMSNAWLVVERMKDYNIMMDIYSVPNGYQVKCRTPDYSFTWLTNSVSAPHAICEAALKAIKELLKVFLDQNENKSR